MRLALVSYMFREDGQIPIGLLTLAEIARRQGVRDIKVLDLPERGDERQFIRLLSDCDVVGFSSICSTYNQTIRLCQRLNAENPNTRIVLGGPQASLTAHESLEAFPFITAIFLGEAEHAWRAFVGRQCFAESLIDVPGIVWRDGDIIRQNALAPIIDDLAALPLPALDLYDFHRGAEITPIEIGRGCPFACSFCSSSPFFKRRFRLKPVNCILSEMDRLYDLHGSRRFYFVQDAFSSRRKFVEEISQALSRHHRQYTWYCSARTDQVSEDLVATMIKAGCRGIYFGLETGSQRMQQVINKGLNVDRALKVIRRTADQGLDVTTSMIIGFPQESQDDLRASLRVFLDLKASGHALVQLHVLAPLPGSALISEGHELHYDGMPSDFSDTVHILDDEDGRLVQSHPRIFANFWHFVNPSVPRQRFLFLAHLLSVASLYFPNTLCLAAKWLRDTLVDRLLDGDMPEAFHSDPTFPTHVERWINLTHAFLEAFVADSGKSPALAHALHYDLAYSLAEIGSLPTLAVLHLPASISSRPGRRIAASLEVGGEMVPYVVQRPEHTVEVIRITEAMSHALVYDEAHADVFALDGPASNPTNSLRNLADVIDEACATCGFCCHEAGGVLCGQDEWPAIRGVLAGRLGREPRAERLEGTELVVVKEQQEIPDLPRADGEDQRMRRACPALVCKDQRWRCSIEVVKPAGCVAYPMKLVLHERNVGDPCTVIGLQFEDMRGRIPCRLEMALRNSPQLLHRYAVLLREKIANRAGTFVLAAYNARKRRLADAVP